MKKVNLFLCAAILIAMSTLTAFVGIEEKSGKRTMINEVKIGNQIWVVENLNVDKFQNGDPIPHAITFAEWKQAKNNQNPAWCYYYNDTNNGEKYGKLYNWYAVNDPRGLAPKGWHVPTDAEWTALTEYLGGDNVAGKKMKNTSGWETNRFATNDSRFSGFPGGFREYSGLFHDIGVKGYWWSSTEVDTRSAWWRELHYNFYNVGRYHNDSKGVGLSVRCLKD